jgi:5-methylcytosine-specific restriction endonuclease McrA
MIEKIKICARCGKEYIGGGRTYCADCAPLAARERNAKTAHAISAQRKQAREELPTEKTLPVYGGVFDRPIIDSRAQLPVDPEREKAIALAALKYRQEVSAQRMRVGRGSVLILQEQERANQTESWEYPSKHTEHYNRRHRRTSVLGWLNKEGFYIKCEALGWRCQICGELLTREAVTIDHIVAVTEGGTNKLTNLQPLCVRCNSIKGIRTMSQARERYLFLESRLQKEG